MRVVSGLCWVAPGLCHAQVHQLSNHIGLNKLLHGWVTVLLELPFQMVKVLLSCVWLCDPPVACQYPPFMGSYRQEHWSGLPVPSPGDLLDPGLPHCRQMLYHLSYQGSPNRASLKLYLGVSKCDLSLGNATGWAEFEQIASVRASYQKLGNFDLKVSRSVRYAKKLGQLFQLVTHYIMNWGD